MKHAEPDEKTTKPNHMESIQWKNNTSHTQASSMDRNSNYSQDTENGHKLTRNTALDMFQDIQVNCLPKVSVVWVIVIYEWDFDG